MRTDEHKQAGIAVVESLLDRGLRQNVFAHKLLEFCKIVNFQHVLYDGV